jgi:hypothetical protein
MRRVYGLPGDSRGAGDHAGRRRLPPAPTASQVGGFTLWATRSILSGRGDEVLEVVRTSLRELSFE